jgi:hypothetical protein
MKSKGLRWTARVRACFVLMAPVVLALGVGGVARAQLGGGGQLQLPAHFSGLLNDYTPAPPLLSAGPYEMHGKWSLDLSAQGTATFSAEMTMELADFTNTAPSLDPTKLGPHTHHISVTDGVVHNEPTDPVNWTTACPAFKPPVAGGFVVTGTAYVTGNGGNPPFGNPSAVTLCILGGLQNPAIAGPQTIVQFSNFTLQFESGSHASTHFGTQAINGVVVQCGNPRVAPNDCKLQLVE